MNKDVFSAAISSLLGPDPLPAVSEKEEKALYTSAFSLYAREEYRKASCVFTRLVLINPFSPFYWKGLAASKQMARDYEASAHAWALSLLLDPDDSQSHLYAAACLSKMGEEKEAALAVKLSSSLSSSEGAL